MKYMLMFCGASEGEEMWANLPEEVRNQGYARIGKWFEALGPRFVSGEELQPTTTATTVTHHEGGGTVVTDGPFIEAKETVGGFAVVDVADLDAALELAKTWPGGGKVEVRPVVER